MLQQETADRIDFERISRLSYILHRSIWFVFKSYEKKWELPAKMTHFCAKIAWKRIFVSDKNEDIT